MNGLGITLRTVTIGLLAVVLSLLAPRSCCAQRFVSPILNPKTYVSQTGVYSLVVDPTDMHGRNAADYRFTGYGKAIWTKRFPFCLWDAVVTNDGRVAGYAYTHGLEGFAASGRTAGLGEFLVVLLSPEGNILSRETHPRKGSRFLHTDPDPLAKGIVLDSHSNRVIVRLRDPDINRGIEQWWTFGLDAGKRTGVLEPAKLMPRNDAFLSILAAQALPGTPLVLVHWWKAVSSRCGAVFTLVDQQGKPVWSLSLDDDYTAPGDENAEDRIREMIRSQGAILSVNKQPAFDLHLVKDHKRVAFSVTEAANGSWAVRETSRTPFTPNAPPQSSVERSLMNPVKVGVVSLSGAGDEGATGIHDVEAFDFDPQGRICALLRREDEAPQLVFLSQQGKLLHALRLPVEQGPKAVRFSNLANVGGSRFVIAVSGQDVGSVAECFLADFAAVSVKKLPEFACPAAKSLAGFDDGRFAALTVRRGKYTSTSGLYLFDSLGKCLWKKESEGYAGRPEELLNPEAIARYGAGAVAVLDNVRCTIQFFDVRGAFLRKIELGKTWGREASYPIHIAEDSDGGLAVYDFHAKASFVRMDSSGRIRSESVPRFADGRPFGVVGGIKRAPQGELWTSDGNALLRLAANGSVDRIVGEAPRFDALSQPDRSVIDMHDRIYVADRRTKIVYVFDALGKPLGRCMPDAKDLSENSSVANIAVSPAGDVFVQLSSMSRDNSYVRFDKDLKRKETARVDLDTVRQDWCFQPIGDLCWVRGRHGVFLVKGLRDTIRTISRRADGCWLEFPHALGVAPDGAIAVLARSESRGVSLSTYGPTGDARVTFAVPHEWIFSELAHDGQHIFIRHETDVFVLHSTGRNLGRFSLGSSATANDWSGPYLAGKGKQLWFFDRKHAAIHKYRTPVSLDAGKLPGRSSTGL